MNRILAILNWLVIPVLWAILWLVAGLALSALLIKFCGAGAFTT